MLHKLLFIAMAGGAGSLCRFGLSGLVHRFLGQGFPWGTFVVNVTGCLLFGLVWGALEERVGLNPEIRLIVLTGFMGAFTTFSTFAFENASMLQDGQWLYTALNLMGQCALGVGAAIIGMALGRMV